MFKAKSDRSSAMNEYYKLDSEGEAQFAHKLENNENVLLFTKLKKGGFVIDTPYGNYSPDWAVVCRKESLEDSGVGIYFIVETKAGKTWSVAAVYSEIGIFFKYPICSPKENTNIAIGDKNTILNLLKKEPAFTAKELSEQTGFSARKISCLVKELREIGKIVRKLCGLQTWSLEKGSKSL